MASTRRPRIPLRNRLPNGPLVFVGREQEGEWLEDALRRSPLAVVRGPAGIGKTALVLHAIARIFPDSARRTLFVAIPPGEPADQVRLNIVHALVQAAGASEEVDLAGMRGDPEDIVASALDLAEQGPFCIVIDDLQHSDAEEMRELLRQLAAYARTSRWIVTTRATDLTDFDAPVLEVGALSTTSLAEIARLNNPQSGHASVLAAVNASAGSPWLMKQYLAAGDDGLALTRAGIIDSLSAASQLFIRTLATIDSPLSPDELARLVPLPPKATLDALIARGLVIETPLGFGVHDMVADFLFHAREDTDETAWREQLADGLGKLGSPDATLEALRLLHAMGKVDALVELLREHGRALLALGYTPRIWALVGASSDPRLGLWQLQCAAELGNSTVLAAIHQPVLSSDSDQLAWALTQYLLGDPVESRRLALNLADAGANEEVVAESRLLAARCLLHMDNVASCAEELQTFEAQGRLAFAQQALQVLAEACLDRPGAALQCSALLAQVPADADPGALLDVAMALYSTGQRDIALETIDQVLSTPRGSRATLLVARRAMLLRARICMLQGDLLEVERLLELVRPYARGVSMLRPILVEIDATRRLLIGDLVGLSAALSRGIELARDADTQVMRRIEDHQRTLSRRTLGSRSQDEGAQADASERGAPSTWEASDVRRLRRRIATAEAALEDGDSLEALDTLVSVRSDAERSGLPLVGVEALLVSADALLVGFHVAELSKAALTIAELGERYLSPRLLHHAAFYEAGSDAAVLERLANTMEEAPVIARRARALLGGASPLGPIDEQVVAAMRAEWTGRTIVTKGQPPSKQGDSWIPAWGMDESRSSFWLPNGRLVSLAKKPLLWRILQVLTSFEVVSKEQLINEAWGEAEYHPLRHDPKLHVAIRALRSKLEDVPSSPNRLMTVDGGYRLNGAMRIIRAHPE